MDTAGNLYGTTYTGGAYSPSGAVFKLTLSNGGWTYTSLHDFNGGSDLGLVRQATSFSMPTATSMAQHHKEAAYNYGVVWEITPYLNIGFSATLATA